MKRLVNYLRWVNLIIGLLCCWVFFHAPGYFMVGGVLAFLPLICWLYALLKSGSIWLGETSSNERPTLLWIHGMVMVLLMNWSLSDFLLLDDHLLPIYITLITLVVVVSLFCRKDEFKLTSKGWVKQLLYALIIVAIQVTGSLVVLNCTVDYSKTVYKKVKVYEKVKKDHLFPEYSIYVNSLDSVSFDEEFSISKQGFLSLNVGDTVSIQFHHGWLGMPWCMLDNQKLLP